MLLHKENQTLPLKNYTYPKLYFEHVSFSENRTVFFADFLFVGRSVGNSRVCRVKSFEIQQSTRIDRIARNPYTLPVKKKDLRNNRS